MALISIASTPAPTQGFFDARLEPPSGRVLSGWGQFSKAWDLGQPAGKGDVDDLEAYSKALAPHLPAMISFDVGLDAVADFLAHYREFAASHGFFIAQIGVDFHGSERDVSTGMRDPQLLVLADGLRDVGRPVLLCIGNQFNKPSTVYEPSAYIGAFRHTTEVWQKDHLNFAAVWESTAQGFSDPHYMKWYPGDDVVDWWGIDIFDAHHLSAAESIAFVDDAKRHDKAVIISGASGSVKSEAEALKWYSSFFEFIRAHPAIKAFSLVTVGGPRTNAIRRWPKVAADLKQRVADPRFIDASEAPTMFRRPSSQR